MSIDYAETRPYNPGPIVVRLTNVPEALKNNETLLDAFTDLIEKRSKSIGNVYSGRQLFVSEQRAGMPFLKTEDGDEYTIDVSVPEVKDKVTTRLLREVTKLCFVGRNPAEVKADGFDLLLYELSEDKSTVIDAWKLSGFTFPNGLSISSEYTSNNSYTPQPAGVVTITAPPVVKAAEYFDLGLSGNLFQSDEVLAEALRMHEHILQMAELDTKRLKEDFLELRGGGQKDA